MTKEDLIIYDGAEKKLRTKKADVPEIIEGPQGPKGDKGDKGDQGELGPRGKIGLTGAKGNEGDLGNPGEKGDKGDKGDTGNIGNSGVDGKNGKDGEDGVDGLSPMEGVDYVIVHGRDGADGIDGSPDTAGEVLTKLLTVDGVASLLDADLLDGEHGNYYQVAGSYLLDTGDTATGDYTFDTNTLVVDSVNHRVGIGTSIPLTTSHIVGGQTGSITYVEDTYNVLTTNYTIVGNKETDFDITLPTGSIGQVFTIKNVGVGNINVKTSVITASVPDVLNDGNTVAWFDVQENITKDVSNFVSVWGDKSGLAHHLLQATGTNQPLWSANGVLFDGIDNFMKCTAFEWNQPEFIYMVVKQVTWTLNDYFFDSNALARGVVYQSGTTPKIRAYAGTVGNENANLAVNTWGIVRCLFNGASSKLIVNNTTPITGNFGTQNMGGFTLGASATPDAWSNIEVKEVILRKVADTAVDEAAIYAYLVAKYDTGNYETIDGEYSQAIPQWDAIKVQCYNDNKWIII